MGIACEPKPISTAWLCKAVCYSGGAMIDGTETVGTGRDFSKRPRRPRVSAGLPAPQAIDRLPPHSIEAEQGVLGCVLLSPNDSLGICIEKFKKGVEVFYDLPHQVIFDTLVEMYDSKHPIDLLTLQQKLKDKNQLEPIGGVTYLSALPDAVPSAANLEYYLEIVREKYVLRRMILTCTGVVSKVYD